MHIQVGKGEFFPFIFLFFCGWRGGSAELTHSHLFLNLKHGEWLARVALLLHFSISCCAGKNNYLIELWREQADVAISHAKLNMLSPPIPLTSSDFLR